MTTPACREMRQPVPFRIGEGEGRKDGGGCGFAPARGSGRDVDGIGLAENISCSDSCEGDRDENGTASFKGRGSPGANAICLSRRLMQKHAETQEWLERPCRVRLSAVVGRHVVANIAEVGLDDGPQRRVKDTKVKEILQVKANARSQDRYVSGWLRVVLLHKFDGR
ncbi:hypothetical protein EDD16DRAFT_1731210 [Pisolithus croceorrhizus]|nr:hypothetical protein EDD16DRAFT_1731210 [Pisolithus croceorrhizus]